MKYSAVKTYTNRKQMNRGVKRMTDAGWLVSNVSEHREQKAHMTIVILLLAITIIGLLLLPFLLLARRTVYTVTFARGEYDKPERYRDIAASDYWKNHKKQDDVQIETTESATDIPEDEVHPMNIKTKLFLGFIVLMTFSFCVSTFVTWGGY